jgi:phosphoserine phosphatase
LTQLALRGIPLPENEMTIMQTWLNLQDKIIIVTGGAQELAWRLLMNY